MKTAEDDLTMHEEETMHGTAHTFGGRFMDRYVYEFETPEGAGAGDGGSGLEADAGAAGDPNDPTLGFEEPGGEPAEGAAAAAAAEAEAISLEDLQGTIRETVGSTFQELLAQAEHADRVRAAEAHRQAEASRQPELPEWDPYDRNVVMAHMNAAMNPILRQMQSMMAPALQAAERMDHQEGESQAKAIVAKFEGEVGKFDHDRAIRNAAYLMRAGVERDAEVALERAAREEAAYAEQLRNEGREAYLATLEGNANAGAEPTGGSAAGEVAALPRGREGYRESTRRALARAGATPGVRVPTG